MTECKTNSDLLITSNLRKSFNSLLPQEIIKEILCSIDGNCLLELKHVCSYWNRLITEILNIKLISCVTLKEDPNNDALVIFKQWYNGRKRFSIYEAPYSVKNLINKPLLSKIFESRVYTLTHCEDYKEALELLKTHASRGGAYSDGSDDVIGDVWRTVLAVTGLNSKYSVDELRGKSFEDNMVKSFMKKYTWYLYKSTEMACFSWDFGMIVLYPDNKTFSDLFAYDYD